MVSSSDTGNDGKETQKEKSGVTRERVPSTPESTTSNSASGVTDPNCDDDNMRRKIKMEAHLTSGCGIGRKKTEMVDAFWKIVWPRLEEEGWTKVEGSGRQMGSIYFVPVGVDVESGRKGMDFYVRIKPVIDRILERRNEAESAIADRYLAEMGGRKADHQLSSRPRRNASSSSSSLRSQKPQPTARLDLSWKDGGKNFPKRSSRVGPEFQAINIPESKTYKQDLKCSERCYDVVWDPKRAEAKGVLDFIEDTIPPNKKEAAMVFLHEMDYHRSNFLTAYSSNEIAPMDGSDWSWEEKKQFHEEAFRLRKDIGAVSKSMGKSIQTCLAYYLGTYKQSDDYYLLKTVCIEEKAGVSSRSDHDLDACAICGDGGSLLICDGCEGEYHMACLRPPLQCVPEGKWECDECVDRNFVAARDYLVQNTKIYEEIPIPRNNNDSGEGLSGSKRKRGETTALSTTSVMVDARQEDSFGEISEAVLRPTAHVLSVVTALAENISDAFS